MNLKSWWTEYSVQDWRAEIKNSAKYSIRQVLNLVGRLNSRATEKKRQRVTSAKSYAGGRAGSKFSAFYLL